MWRGWGTILILAISGCTGSGGVSGTPTATPQSGVDVRSAEVKAASLVGSWVSSDGGDATLAYRFEADGKYRFAGVLTQPVSEGIRKYVHAAEGVAEVSGAALLLRPTRAIATRTDPSDPAGDFTDRPEPLVERAFSWRIDGAMLTLVGEDGNELRFDRQES